MRSRHRLVGRIATAVGLTTFMMSGVTQDAAASVIPKSGVIEVTGYDNVAGSGSSGPVTVTVNHRQAADIRRALIALAVTSPADCHALSDAFAIRILPHKGAPPTFVAVEKDCPSPGVVSITKNGRTIQTLRENCSLRAVVLAALPRGRAEGTRRDKRGCSP
jgi:hypothetical protein